MSGGNAEAVTPKKRSPLRYVLYVLIAIVLLVAIPFGVAATRPDDFRVTRSLSIPAPPSAVFPHVNDLRKWEAWSPYDKRDPAMKRTYTGPESGTGAKYAWNGNNEVGEGSSTIIESRPNELVKLDLHFIRPFEGRNVADFTFKPEKKSDNTLVTWSLEGKHTLISKVMCLFMSMDKMVGADFETGLQNLKTVVNADIKK